MSPDYAARRQPLDNNINEPPTEDVNKPGEATKYGNKAGNNLAML